MFRVLLLISFLFYSSVFAETYVKAADGACYLEKSLGCDKSYNVSCNSDFYFVTNVIDYDGGEDNCYIYKINQCDDNAYDYQGYQVEKVTSTPSCPDGETWNSNTCQCEVSCPDGQYKGDDGQCHNIPQCQDNQYLDDNYVCITPPYPDFFPDANLTSGAMNIIRSSAVSPEDCTPDNTSSGHMGLYKALYYSNNTKECVVARYFCASGYFYDDTKKQCVLAPDNMYFPNNPDNPNDPANFCPGNTFAKRGLVDLCPTLAITYRSTPNGYEQYNLKQGFKYIEYACVKDYRIKKFLPTSCGKTPLNTSETHDLNITASSVQAPTISNDINGSELPTIDPNDFSATNSLQHIDDVISNQLKPIFESQKQSLKDLNTKLTSTNSELGGIKDGIGNVNSKLSTTNEQLGDIKGSIDGIKNMQGSFQDGVNTLNANQNSLGLDGSGLADSSSYLDNLKDNLSDLTGDITSIKDKFTELETLLKGEQPVLSIQSGSCSDENLQKFINYVSPYSSIISLVTYIGLMISIFKFIFMYFSSRS